MSVKLRVFISSPGDVSEERALAERVFSRLGAEFADRAELALVLWEHEPLFAHTGFQQQIQRPSGCDLVVSILWSRLGTRLPSDFSPSPGQPPPTGTEFEIRDALDAYRRLGKPNLLIYRKSVAPQVNLASPLAEERLRQYRLLDEFCRHAFYDGQGVALIAHHHYAETYEFERKLAEHARKWLERQVGDVVTRPRWTSGSPYRGLQTFEAEHKEVYFGRGQALSELMKRMRGAESRAADGAAITRFLLVQGMSGNGKSSLIRAGLLPLLDGRALEGIGNWRHVTLKPSSRSARWPQAGVTGALAEVLAKALPTLEESYPGVQPLADRLRLSPKESAARLDGYLAREATQAGLRPDQIRLVLFLDQLEEIFAASIALDERESFLSVIAALSREGRIWIVATMRSDFAAKLEEHPELVSLSRDGSVLLLGPPHPDELADMIREPARAAGLEWDDRDGVSLDQAILREATRNPESLPLLEYALDQLYEHRDGRRLVYVAYAALGGLQGGIAGTAERVLEQQGESAKRAFAKLMRNLASVDENGTATRRYAPLSEFPEGSPERDLLEALVARRLCVADRLGSEPVVSFAHEALIQSWPRVVEWLQMEAGLIQARDVLVTEAHRWEQHGERDGWLATAPDHFASLQAVLAAGVPLPTVATRFAARSKRRMKRLQFVKRTAIATVAVLSVGVGVFAWFAVSQRNAATAAQTRAELEAKTARATTDFLVGLFAEVDPAHSRGNTLLAREVMDHGLQKVKHELQDQPPVRAELLRTIGTVYDTLGLTTQGEEALREALAIAEQSPAMSRLELARARFSLAFAIVDSGQATESERLYRQAIAFYDSQPEFLLDATNARAGLAYVLLTLGRCREGFDMMSAARTKAIAISGANSDLSAGILETLGKLEGCLGRPDQALADMKEALQIRKELFGEDYYWYAAGLYGIGFELWHMGRLVEAEDYFARSVPLLEHALGKDHSWLAIALYGYGGVVGDLGRYDEATKLLERSIAMFKSTDTAKSTDAGNALYYTGRMLAQLEKYDRALGYLKEAMDQAEAKKEMSPVTYAMALDMYGLVLARSGRSVDAVPLQRKALTVIEGHEANPGYRRLAINALVESLCFNGSSPEGYALAQRVKTLDLARQTDWERALDNGLRAECDPDKSHFADNELALRDAVVITSRDRGPHSPFTRDMVRRLIRFYRAAGLTGRAAEGERQLSTVYALAANTK